MSSRPRMYVGSLERRAWLDPVYDYEDSRRVLRVLCGTRLFGVLVYPLPLLISRSLT